jgi:hypothetical protein
MANSEPKPNEPKPGSTGADAQTTSAKPATWVPVSHALRAMLVLVLWRYALPIHSPTIDLVSLGLSAALIVSAVGVSLRTSWGLRFAGAVTLTMLLVGALLTGALLLSILYLLGVHNPLAPGGIVLFAAITLLIAPYMLVLPGLELRALRQATNSSLVPPVRVGSELAQ